MRVDIDETELRELLDNLVKYLRGDRNHIAKMLKQQFHRTDTTYAKWSCGNYDYNVTLEFYKKPHSKK